jgi:GTP-binding protein
MKQENLRNIAIIAHVDHGKTTLVDQLLHSAGTFHERQVVDERVMDSNDLERERGITILSKNAAIDYKGCRINIVDTPGHADFGGQVERVLGTVDGVLLLVDAFEGPMAQTRFVTRKALELGLRPIVVVNKIDRDGCDPHNALDQVFDLFCDLDADEEQLAFPHIYASARNGLAKLEMEDADGDMSLLLDMIVDKCPAPNGDLEADPLLQISGLEYSEFLGQLAVGRLQTGKLRVGATYNQSLPDGKNRSVRVQKLLKYEGIRLQECEEAIAGEIVLIAGLADFDIGDTISAKENPVSLKRTELDPPTISMDFSVNTSPLSGKSGGKFLTGSHLIARLERAQLADPALMIEKSDQGSTWRVSGRGVLHLTILIENMRREGYEFTVGAPQVIYKKDENGKILEPVEIFKVQVPQEYSGAIIDALSKRKGEMLHMEPKGSETHLEYRIPSRGLIGIRSILLSLSSGYAVTQSLFEGYAEKKGDIVKRANGVLISKDSGQSTGYALWKLEDRGTMIIPPGEEVYEGMIVGEANRGDDIVVNITKGKQLTNVRSSGADDNIMLTPHRQMTLEDCIIFINDDEAVEVTPDRLRVRKIYLVEHERKKIAKYGTLDLGNGR